MWSENMLVLLGKVSITAHAGDVSAQTLEGRPNGYCGIFTHTQGWLLHVACWSFEGWAGCGWASGACPDRRARFRVHASSRGCESIFWGCWGWRLGVLDHEGSFCYFFSSCAREGGNLCVSGGDLLSLPAALWPNRTRAVH